MNNGFHETFPDVFQSGALNTQEPLLFKISLERKKPVAIFNLADQQFITEVGENWPVFWFNYEDRPTKDARLIAADYQLVAKLAKNLYDRGHVIWFHCWMGMNRSTMANIAFRQLTVAGESVGDSLRQIQRVRPCVNLARETEKALKYLGNREL